MHFRRLLKCCDRKGEVTKASNNAKKVCQRKENTENAYNEKSSQRTVKIFRTTAAETKSEPLAHLELLNAIINPALVLVDIGPG